MDIKTLISVLQSHKFDSDRNSSLSGLIKCININIKSNEIKHIISLYKYDDDRNKALRIIVDHITTIYSDDIINICYTYIYDDDRTRGLSILSKRIDTITGNDVNRLMKLYKYDDDRVKAIKTIINFVESISSEDFSNICGHFVYDSDKAKAIPFLIPKIGGKTTPSKKEIYEDNDKTKIKMEFFMFIDNIKSLSDNDKLKIIEKTIPSLDISNIESRCKEIKEYFKTDNSFQDACELLGINPEIKEDVEKIIKIENEAKIKENNMIEIGSSYYSKDLFKKGHSYEINNDGLKVIITNDGKWFNIIANSNNGGMCETSVQLGDKITIGCGGYNKGSMIGNGYVNISI